MREVKSYGHVGKNGKLNIAYVDRFKNALQNFEFNTKVEVIVRKIYNNRSNNQNGYYWAVIVNEFKIAIYEQNREQLTAKEVHEILKMQCNSKDVVNEDTGLVMTISKETKNMSTVEHNDYCERCREFIFDFFNVKIPLPNEVLELDL